jgi:hypothetical protein
LGFCGFAAASASLELIGQQAFDLVALIAVIAATIGGSLAWYIPAAAASTKRDPLAQARSTQSACGKALA